MKTFLSFYLAIILISQTAIFVIHTEFPRFIMNLENDEVEWFEDFSQDEKELSEEAESLIEAATAFYDREISRYEDYRMLEELVQFDKELFLFLNGLGTAIGMAFGCISQINGARFLFTFFWPSSRTNNLGLKSSSYFLL